MKNKNERLRQLTKDARHMSPVHNAPSPEIDSVALFSEERAALVRILMDLGVESITLKEEVTMAEIFSPCHIEASRALNSPLMNKLRKKYGFFDIAPNDTLLEVLKKMHKNRK